MFPGQALTIPPRTSGENIRSIYSIENVNKTLYFNLIENRSFLLIKPNGLHGESTPSDCTYNEHMHKIWKGYFIELFSDFSEESNKYYNKRLYRNWAGTVMPW